MAKNAESIIQGLNIIPTDNTTISDELSPMSDDIEAQLALWTNLQFPSPNTLPSSSSSVHHPDADQMIEEDERIFSPERDNASRSRHKAIEDFPSGHFFGNVGASLAHHRYHHHSGSHTAAHERAKFQQLQQHLLHNKNNNNKGHDNNAAAANGNGSAAGGEMGNNHQINELFSFFPDGDMNLNPGIVDPFLNPSDVAAGVGGGGGGYLPPLTIRHPIHGRPQHPEFPVHNSNMPQLQMHHQQQQQQQMQTIDPATTTLGHNHHHHVSLPHALPSPTAPSMKRQQKKGSVSSSSSRNVIIPVDHDYTTAPNSAIGGDDDMDHEFRLHNQDHDDSSGNGNGNGMDGLDDLNNPPPPPQLDASGNPIPYSPAEDKRRRNTLASARFRQKKKEREAAMERKARELDERVAGLERECESLRKENRMLRGLLVDGVPAAVTSITSSSSNSSNSNGNGNSNANSASTSSNSAEEISNGKRNFIGSRESVVLLEEFVKLLKANSSMLNNGGGNEGQGHAAPTPNGRTGSTTTAGKRKRGGGN